MQNRNGDSTSPIRCRWLLGGAVSVLLVGWPCSFAAAQLAPAAATRPEERTERATSLKTAARSAFHAADLNKAREHLQALLALYRRLRPEGRSLAEQRQWSQRLCEVAQEYLRGGQLQEAAELLGEAAALNLPFGESQDDGLASAAAGWFRRLAGLAANERYELLYDWSMPADWNRVSITLADDMITLSLNDAAIYQRKMEPENARTFGFYRDRTRWAQIRNVVLRGDWPERLSDQQLSNLAAVSADRTMAERHALHALFEEPNLARGRFTAAPRLKNWAPVSYATSKTRGEGYPRPHWQLGDKRVDKLAGHECDYLMFRIPLRGNYEVECDLTLFGWRDTELMVAGTCVAPHWDRMSYEVDTFGEKKQRLELDRMLGQSAAAKQ